MNPQYIIDGYNVIHNVPRLRDALNQSLEHGRNMLVSLVRAYQSSHRTKMSLVFDGDEIGGASNEFTSTKWLKVIYSKPPEKADPLIKRMIRKTPNKKSLFVVSADNEIIQSARQHGAHVLSPDEFYFRATKHPVQDQLNQKYSEKISEQELDEWLKLFGEEDE